MEVAKACIEARDFESTCGIKVSLFYELVCACIMQVLLCILLGLLTLTNIFRT